MSRDRGGIGASRLHKTSWRLGVPLWALLCLLGCAGEPRGRSIERIDERSGVTTARLPRPLAFMESGVDLMVPDKQPSTVYLGPLEADRAGDLSYLLWVQVALGAGGHRLDDIRQRDAFTLKLDDGTVTLAALEHPPPEGSLYRARGAADQTAYFPIDVALLRRMASSRTLKLNLRTADQSRVDFLPLQDTQAALVQFMMERQIGGD